MTTRDDPLRTTDELAQQIRRPKQYIYDLNHRGVGPRRIRVGKHLLYRQSDIDAWLDSLAVDDEQAVAEA